MRAKPIDVEQNTCTIGLWVLLTLLVLIASTGCATTVQPSQESNPVKGETGVSQEAPPVRTRGLITVDPNALPSVPEIRKATEACQDLQGTLLQIVESADPVQEAQALGLNVREDKVQVIMILNAQDGAFLRQAGIDVGQQTGPKIQAFVPISQLCELAADKRIQTIDPVHQAETQ